MSSRKNTEKKYLVNTAKQNLSAVSPEFIPATDSIDVSDDSINMGFDIIPEIKNQQSKKNPHR